MIKYIRLIGKEALPIAFSTCWIRRYARHPERYNIFLRYARLRHLVIHLTDVLKCRFYVTGENNIPTDTNVLFTPNHQSNMDPIIMMSLSRRPLSFLSKKEARRFPWVGKVLMLLNGVFMDRKDFHSEVRSLTKITSNLRAIPEQSIVIFPEGTRSRDIYHHVASFKGGSLKPAYSASKPIVPVAIYGSFRCLDGRLRMRYFPIQIAFLKPHLPAEFASKTTAELAAEIESEVKAKVEELRQNDRKLSQEASIARLKLPADIKGL